MAIVVSAAIETSQAAAGALRFNGALASMRSGVASTGQALAGLSASLLRLPTLLVAAGLGAMAKKAVEAGDSFIQLKARLALVAQEGTPVESLMAGIAEAALRARVPVSELSASYTKTANALADLKYSQADGIRMSETLAKVIKLSGASAAETASTMHQLGQAINSGRLQGEEWNAVAEGAPEILRIMQAETGKTRGELKKLAEEGKITGKTIAQTLLNASAEIDAKFARMPQTAGEAFAATSDAISQAFGKASEASGLSQAWAEVFNSIREGAGGSAMQGAFRTFADLLASAGRGFTSLIGFIGEARIAISGWISAIQETTAYRALSTTVESLGRAFEYVRGAVGTAMDGLKFAAASAMPETSAALGSIADRAAQASEQLRVFEKLKGTITTEAPLKASEPAAKKKVEFGKGDTSDEIKKLQQLIKTESLQYQLKKSAMADLGGLESDQTFELRTQLDIHGKITKEMREASPALAKRLEAEIRATNELERQQAIYEKNRELGERFASGISDAFRSAAESGKSFGASLRGVLARLVDMTMQALILEPLVKSIGKSFAGQAGGTDVAGSIFSAVIGGITGAPAAGIGSWTTTAIPAFANGGVVDRMTPFSHSGGLGIMGEAGPEAIMPLRRGADGKLGVAAASSGPSSIVFNVSGNPDQSALAQMERLARQIVADAAPGIVSTSVRQVGARHRDDPRYLRR